MAAERSARQPGQRVGAVGAVGLAAAAGLVDDLRGDDQAKGLKGHLGALKRGRVTTGLIKLVLLTAGAALFAVNQNRDRLFLIDSGAVRKTGRFPFVKPIRRVALIGLDTVLVAGTANLINLLDLRPGRAIKAAALPAACLAVTPGEGGELAAGLVGAAASVAPSDLAEETLLGDCGANALGAALGVAMARSLAWPGRLVAAGIVTGLNLASEKVSFSQLIAANPTLRRLDELGRVGGDQASDPGSREPTR
jgi:hypothetical protein